jgi:hypothetical protein
LLPFCRKHPIARLEVFGSVADGTAAADSDVDLIVTFDPGGVDKCHSDPSLCGVLDHYPYPTHEDVTALRFAAWRTENRQMTYPRFPSRVLVTGGCVT